MSTHHAGSLTDREHELIKDLQALEDQIDGCRQSLQVTYAGNKYRITEELHYLEQLKHTKQNELNKLKHGKAS